jgi:hypothetical protein
VRLLSVVSVLCLSVCAHAASGVNLAGLKMGKTVSGPDLTTKDLRGKCVLVVYWGTH